MPKLQIGQEIVIKDDFEIESALGNEKRVVEKGDRGVVTSSGLVQYVSGNARGKIQKIEDVELKGYDTENIAKLVFQRLNSQYQIKDFLEDWDIETKDFIGEIEWVLSEIL